MRTTRARRNGEVAEIEESRRWTTEARSWSLSTAPSPAGCASATRWEWGLAAESRFDLALTELRDSEHRFLVRSAATVAPT
jgi:hypothetical protein